MFGVLDGGGFSMWDLGLESCTYLTLLLVTVKMTAKTFLLPQSLSSLGI